MCIRDRQKCLMAKIGIISLGCPKNTVDSEEMLGCLSDEYEITTDESDADVLIINTCGFIESAKEESVYTILNAIQYKQDKCKAVIVTGCLVQRYGAELAEEIKEVDAFIGLGKANKLSEKILKILNGNKISDPVSYTHLNKLKTDLNIAAESF